MTLPNYFVVLNVAGLLSLLDLIVLAPLFTLYFGSGYQPKSLLNSRIGLSAVFILWLSASVGLIFGVQIPAVRILSILGLFLLCRLFYISRRFTNLFRGCGAVGFMPHFLFFYALLFEVSFIFDRSGHVTESVLLLMRVDLAFIMLCAGLYKALVGYFQRHGFEFALANPMWCYFRRFFRNQRPDHPLFHLQNLGASLSEIAAGVLFLIPSLVPLAALLTIAIFLYLTPLLRLGRLFPMVMALFLLFLPDLGFYSGSSVIPALMIPQWPAVIASLIAATYVGIALIVMTKIMQYTNLFFQRRLPGPLQRMLDLFSSVWPVTLWRVFTADIINFFIRISFIDRESGAETRFVDEDSTYCFPKNGNWLFHHRYLQAAESVTLAATFNSLKYFASNRAIFAEKLCRYAHTLPVDPNSAVVKFEFVLIEKGRERFEYTPKAAFLVDLLTDTVTEDASISAGEGVVRTKFSPIQESVGYGSYVPKGS